MILSLERRLQWGLAFSLVVLMGMVWLVGGQAIRGSAEALAISRLEHDAETLLGALRIDGSKPVLDGARIGQVYQRPFSGHYYRIVLAGGGELISRSLWDFELPVPQPGQGEVLWHYQAGPGDQQLLLWSRGYRKQGRDLVIAVAEEMGAVLQQERRYHRRLAVLALGGLMLLLLVQGLLLRRSFRRLDVVHDDIRLLEQGKRQSLSEEVPIEVLPLVQEFNRLLALLGQRLVHSRNALSNLAHALKTPLNGLVRYFDDDVPQEQRAVARQQVERIRSLMERELARARLAGQGGVVKRFDAAVELPDLIAVLRQVHAGRGLDIRFRLNDSCVPFGEREDMLELLGNLLDNACKWAASQVRCRIEVNDRVRIEVSDDGPGVSEEDLDRLAERGLRLDEHAEGHGLGLAIVKDIVSLYGGTLRFERARLGGLAVIAEFARS